MCRVILRPQSRALGGVAPSQTPTTFADLVPSFESAAFLDPKQEADSAAPLLDVSDAFDLQETDADLLAMFQELSDNPVDQLVDLSGPAVETPLAPAPVPAVEPLVALSHPVASAPGPMTMFEQQMMFQQAMMQQAAMANQMVAKPSCYPVLRRGKTSEEIAAQVERTKQRRRESAHRSRSRRKDYMKTLEDENDALRAENAALKAKLKAAGTPLASSSPAGTNASRQHSASHDTGSSSEVAAMQL